MKIEGEAGNDQEGAEKTIQKAIQKILADSLEVWIEGRGDMA